MSEVRVFLSRVMAETPRGLTDALALIVIAAFLACAVAAAWRIRAR